VLTIRSGHSVRYYTDATAEGRENYYTGAVSEGEPSGRWYGTGAEQLGLRGLVRTQDMLGLYERYLDPRDPRFADESLWEEASTLGHTGRNYLSEEDIYRAALDAEPDADAQRRDELRIEAGQRARHNVSYLDATFSVQKSITVLHAAFEYQQIQARRSGDEDSVAAWGILRNAVEDAIWVGNNAGLDYLSSHAGYSRIGHHGGAGGQWIDAHDFTVASFFQHDSRDHDPQLHIHNTILNRVLCSDGVWRTLDSRAIHAFRPAAAAVAERSTEEHLTASLGALCAMRPDGKAREIVGMPEAARELLSSRSRAIGPKAAALVEAFEDRHGRAPTALERDRICRQANLTTRRSKAGFETVEKRLDRVDHQVAEALGTDLGGLAHQVLAQARGERPQPEAWSPREVIETALAAVAAKQAKWNPPDLTREISNALPDHLGITDPAQIAALLDDLTDRALAVAVTLDVAKPGDAALAAQFRLANGHSAFVGPGRARYATPEQLHTERLLVAATASRDARATSTAAARAFVAGLADSGIELGADQAAVLTGVLTSGARVESLIGPAGAGKSFVLGALAEAWADPRTWPTPVTPGQVFGLATSQKAAGVLEAEGLTAANTAAWLAAQARITEGRTRDGDQRWALGAGDLVVIDESSMADTAAIAAVHRRITAAGAKMLLVGDHRQLGAVGAGGTAELLAERGPCYELTEVRRFQQTWEGPASLRLRAGDPTSLADYHREGRILDGGTVENAEAQASRGWLADTLVGKRSVLVVDTNEQAARINARMRAQLVELGRVVEHGHVLGRDGTTAGVGDAVLARRLAWELRGYAGNRRGPITGEAYRVLDVLDNGGLVVAPVVASAGADGIEQLGERMTLPASYVAADLTLGYAATVHAVEGLTVDTGHAVATPRTAATSLYPAATRGRETNHLYVVTRTAADDAAPGEIAQALTRNPRAVLATILETTETEKSALATAAESAAEAVSIRTAAERLAAVAEVTVAERTATWLDELTAAGELTFVQRRRLAAEDGGRKLAPILRRIELSGADPRAALAGAVGGRSLDSAQQISNVLVHRLTEGRTFDPVGTSFADWAPATDDPGLAAQLAEITAAADGRRRDLGAQLADEPPAWALEAFGVVPTDTAERAAWAERAGQVAAHRELVEHDDPTDVLGPAPKPGQIEAYASWRAASRALGVADADSHEQSLSDGQLRMRVRAYQREIPWAPRRIANELAGTIQAVQHHRQTAELKTAHAQAVTDPAQREQLTREATEAAALADTLETQIPVLRRLDEQWLTWYAHTAGTRAAADRAHAELANRHALDPAGEQHVTAAEWLEADADARRDDDPYRQITETDLADADQDGQVYTSRAEPERADEDEEGCGDADPVHPGSADERRAGEEQEEQIDKGRADSDRPDLARADQAEPNEDSADELSADDERPFDDDAVDEDPADEQPADEDQAEGNRTEVDRAKAYVHPVEVLDLRELVADQNAGADEDLVRVPTAAETSDDVRRAERALAEIRARDAADAAREAEEQAARVAYWHAAGTTNAEAASNERSEPVLEQVDHG
jgi:hypothetical protein